MAFTLLTSDDPVMVKMAEELSRQWRAVGIDVTVRPVADDAATDFIRSRDFDAALTEIGLTADPDPYPLWHSTQAESGQNFSGFANEDADLLMEDGRFTTDPEQRTELYHCLSANLCGGGALLAAVLPDLFYAVDDQVQGVQLSPLLYSSDRFRNITDWYVETEEVVVSENDGLTKSANSGKVGVLCRSGGTGRRAAFRAQWALCPCGFNSHLRHQIPVLSDRDFLLSRPGEAGMA